MEFGWGCVAVAGRWAREQGASRILVVTSPSNRHRIDRLELPGEVTVFDRVPAEPDDGDLLALLAAARLVSPGIVVGMGGGSVMDLARLAAVLAGSAQTLAEVAGVDRVGARRCKLIQVPTTSETGSEVGTRALVSDRTSRQKIAVQSDHMLADLAVIDPQLTVTAPPHLTATTGVDALAHCVEAFTSKRSHPLVDVYAIEGIRLVGRYLGRAVQDGSDRETRSGLSHASLLGGLCLGPVNTTAGHAVAYPLGARHHVAHGAANALVFPHTLAFNAPAVPDKTSQILAALGLDPTLPVPEIVREVGIFCSGLGCVIRLSELSILRDDLPVMATAAHGIRRLLDNNPRELERDDILEIYEAVF